MSNLEVESKELDKIWTLPPDNKYLFMLPIDAMNKTLSSTQDTVNLQIAVKEKCQLGIIILDKKCVEEQSL